MITAIIRNKDAALILEFPREVYREQIAERKTENDI